MLKRYKTIKQHDLKDCGAACIAMILKRYQSNVPISKIREIAGTDSAGTNMMGLMRTLETFRFQTKALKVGMEIFEDKNLPYPAIAHVVKDGNLLHYVVVQEVKKDCLIVSDPADRTKKIKKSDFEQLFTGVLLFCVPSGEYMQLDEDDDSLWKIFKVFTKDYKLIIHTILTSLLVMILSIVTSFYFQSLIDTLIPGASLTNLNIVSIGLLILYVFQSVFDFIKSYFLAILGNRISVKVMLGYYHHVLSLPMNFFATRQSGEIVSRFMDASKVIDALASSTLTIVLDVAMLIVTGIVMLLNSGTLFFFQLSMIPFYAVVIFAFVRFYERANEKEMEKSALLNAYIIESLNGIETIKAGNSERQVSKKTDGLFISYIESAFRTFKIENLQSLLKKVLQLVSGGVILWLGAGIVIRGEMSIGQLATFNILASYFSGSLQNIINLQSTLQSARVAARRLDDVMVIEPETDKKEEIKIMSPRVFDNELVVDNLSFHYPMKRIFLENISMSIRKGEKVAFVGKSGAGKSTLAKLFVNFYEATQGKILYGGHFIQDIQKTVLRECVSLLPQTAFFFSGSLYENLVFGLNREVDMTEIIEVCKLAEINDFIESQPLRYNFFVEENGGNLSGGQKQRLAIARALLRQPKLLILDEATSSLDAQTEKAIMENLFTMKELTILFIGHRLSALRDCSRLFVFDEGKIVESGTHEELLAQKSMYYEMWQV